MSTATALALPAQLDIDLGRAPLDALTRAVDAWPAGRPVVIDATPLQQFDSSALALLLGLKRHCQATGRQLQVHGLPQRLCGLAKLYGLAELFPQG
jgi:phospholipid transport system transporter-binding protein